MYPAENSENEESSIPSFDMRKFQAQALGLDADQISIIDPAAKTAENMGNVGGPSRPQTVAPSLPSLPDENDAPVTVPGASTLGVSVENMAHKTISMRSLLEQVAQLGGSDLHLSAHLEPQSRIDGDMRTLAGWPKVSAEQIRDSLYSILTEQQRKKFEKSKELDFAYALDNGVRFRGNAMYERGSVSAVFRTIPNEIVSLQALNLPKVLYRFASLPRGLVLVTGPTGSGKSTTLAAMIDHINQTRSGNIITIEDPIEFLHSHKSCVIRQREVGTDTESYGAALKHVLRQDPDVILIGEMRDLETISTALTAAETGHLVFATLHTQSAAETISRLIDVFPPGQQQQIRSQVASTLKGVVCQTLVKRADNNGRIAAAEVMVVNPAIATQIRRDETHQINQALQSGAKEGMQTLNQHLAQLVVNHTIERSAAEEKSSDPKDLASLIEGSRNRRRNLQAADTDNLSGASL